MKTNAQRVGRRTDEPPDFSGSERFRTLRLERVVEEPCVKNAGGWTLTPRAFRRLLDWLDENRESGGERYLEMRRRLALYFDRKNCPSPDELADETLNRVARRLEEEGAIETDSPAHYCYIVARFVMLESVRNQRREAPLDETFGRDCVGIDGIPPVADELQTREQRLNCLDRCMSHLDSNERELIVAYYYGEQRAKIENRNAIAHRMGLTKNALSIRACRLRGRLDSCMRKCIEANE